MSPTAKIKERTRCPSCGTNGRHASVATLRALLKDECRGQFTKAEANSCGHSDDATGYGCQPTGNETGWRYCDAPNCDVVYFAEQSDATFAKSDLRVEVGVKETSGERPLCYCFGHSVDSIKQELFAKGQSDALDEIRAKMNTPGCRCETENPSGSCCLGSVANGIQIAQEELKSTDAAPRANASAS